MKKAISTLVLTTVLMFGSTFAFAGEDGIIVAGFGDSGNPCTENTSTKDKDGIIVAGFNDDGIIVAGFTGIIVAGFTGIIVAGLSSDDGPTNCGIIVAG